jgi:transaldolase
MALYTRLPSFGPIRRGFPNTLPPATLDAFRDHGRIRTSLVENLDSAEATMQTLATAGISIDEVTGKLTDDGVRLFVEAFAKLLEAVEKNATSQKSLRN